MFSSHPARLMSPRDLKNSQFLDFLQDEVGEVKPVEELKHFFSGQQFFQLSLGYLFVNVWEDRRQVFADTMRSLDFSSALMGSMLFLYTLTELDF